MPIFVDNLGLMEKRYGMKISLKNIYQFRVIGPDGKVAAYQMTKEAIEPLLKKAKWKYTWSDYDARLHPVIELFEWGQYETGLKHLQTLRKSSDTKLATDARKFYALVRKEAEGWKAEADGLAEREPFAALDLYARLRKLFPTDPLAKETVAPLKKLLKEKSVQKELAARKLYNKMLASLGTLTPAQKPVVVRYLQGIAKKYPDTPTAAKADALAKELSD